MALSFGDYDPAGPSSGIDLHALWLILVRYRMMMLGIMVAALAAGVASIWLTKPVYSATASIQIDPQAPRVTGTEDAAPDAGKTENDRILQTQVDLLTSRSTAQNVVDKLNLAKNPEFLRELDLENVPAGPVRTAMVTTAVQQRLTVSSPRDTRIIAVGFESQDAATAARTANTFAETFINDSLYRRLDTYGYSRNFLQGQLEATRGRLEQSERNLVNYARSAGLVDAGNAAGVAGHDGERASITSSSLVDLNAAYSQAQANRMQAQQRWEQAKATPVMSLPDVLANPAIQELTRQRAELQATLQEERQRRQDDHPAIIQAKAQIAELDRQIGTIAAGNPRVHRQPVPRRRWPGIGAQEQRQRPEGRNLHRTGEGRPLQHPEAAGRHRPEPLQHPAAALQRRQHASGQHHQRNLDHRPGADPISPSVSAPGDEHGACRARRHRAFPWRGHRAQPDGRQGAGSWRRGARLQCAAARRCPAG